MIKLPGPKSEKVLKKIKQLNIGYTDFYPFVYSGEGSGCYFKDVDGNKFLDFASQIATNPLGYNDPDLKNVVQRYSKNHPIKYGGQDFAVKEHGEMLEALTSITPKQLDNAILLNSGAEAVENCLKIALRKQKKAKFGIAFEKAFHGRTLGALSCTSSKPIQTQNFLFIPVKRLPYNENALELLQKIINKASSTRDIGFVIIEPIQGEGGYNVASPELIKGLRKITKQYDIPFIADEVQSGLGRTGKWWCIEHYNVEPDVMSSAKALQVGAAISNRKWMPAPGTLSSTWGGGHVLDLALGIETIHIIKKRKLLSNVNKTGKYLMKRLNEANMENVRGKGLMVAFDMPTRSMRNNFIIECLKNGLVLLGCGQNGIRVIPPYIVTKEEIDKAIPIIEKVALKTSTAIFKHTGKICNYLTCGEVPS